MARMTGKRLVEVLMPRHPIRGSAWSGMLRHIVRIVRNYMLQHSLSGPPQIIYMTNDIALVGQEEFRDREDATQVCTRGDIDPVYPRTRSLTHAPTHLPTHSHTHSLAHSLTHSLTHTHTHTHTHSHTHTHTHSPTRHAQIIRAFGAAVAEVLKGDANNPPTIHILCLQVSRYPGHLLANSHALFFPALCAEMGRAKGFTCSFALAQVVVTHTHTYMHVFLYIHTHTD